MNEVDYVKCFCDKWKANDLQIKSIHILDYVTPFKVYTKVEKFKFCPYCGKELTNIIVEKKE